MKPIHPFKTTAVKYGIYLAFSLIVLFMFAETTSLSGSLAFRLIDVFVIFFIVGRSMHFYQTHTSEGNSYLKNLGLAVATAFFGMFFFAIFIFCYMTFINPGYLEYQVANAPMGPHLNPYIIAVFLIIEGAAVGALSGFIQVFLIRKPEL